MTATSTATTQSRAETAGQTPPALLDRVWRVLTRPWLLLALAGLALLLTLIASFVPQLPGQFETDPVSASRWFLTTANEYGALGGTLRDLGLFDFSHSLTLRLLLAGLGLLLLLHTAELLRRAWALQGISAAVAAAPAVIAAPVEVGSGLVVARRRWAAELPADQVAAALTEKLTGKSAGNLAGNLADDLIQPFPRLRTTTHPVAERSIPGPDGPVPLSESGGEPAEIRLLGVTNLWAAWLRAAGGAGLVLALAGLWVVVNLGWSVDLPLLTPGAEFRYAPESLALAYTVPSGRPPAQLQVNVADAVLLVSSDAAEQSARLGAVTVRARPVSPGLLVITNQDALAPAGQGQLVRRVGLLFPTPGAEETITLPGQESALRLVRLPGAAGEVDPTFLVELFDASSLVSGEPVQRLELQGNEASSIFLDGGQLQIAFVPMPGLSVSVRAMPGQWILWPALILAVVGGVGFLRCPRFVLAQIAPWPIDRTVLIVQSDDPDALNLTINHQPSTINR